MAEQSPQPEPRLLAQADRPWRLAVGLVLPLSVAAAPAFLSLGSIPLCAFKHATGLPCPLCGGIRACAALAHGDLSAAFFLNPGLMPVLVLAALHGGVLLVEGLCGRKLLPENALARVWTWAGLFCLFVWCLRVLYAF